jgi:hypothetical protein
MNKIELGLLKVRKCSIFQCSAWGDRNRAFGWLVIPSKWVTSRGEASDSRSRLTRAINGRERREK